MMPKRPVTSKHQQLFFRNCYTCNNFGHMARNYKLKTPVEKGITSHTFFYDKNITKNNLKGRNYNSLSPLQSYSTECYKCGNHGHIPRKCKLVTPMDDTSKFQYKGIAWKRKGDVGFSLALCATEKQNLWNMDSGCSKHMTCDPTKFLSLKRKQKGKGNFGDNLSSKIIGKGTMVIRDKMKDENVLIVENLKPNILSVIQTCDQGHMYI